MFKWTCLAAAAALVAVAIWMINDLRLEVVRTSATVNEHLAEILENTRETSATLAQVSEDIRQLRDLAGVTSGARDRSLVTFADGILDHIEQADAQIGTKALIGGGLRSAQPAAEWVADARKEALWLSFRASGREELLRRLCQSKFGNDWHIVPGGGERTRLIDWLAATHQPTNLNPAPTTPKPDQPQPDP